MTFESVKSLVPTFLLQVTVCVTGQYLLCPGTAQAQSKGSRGVSERQQQYECLAGLHLEAFAQMGLNCKRVLGLAEDLEKLIV